MIRPALRDQAFLADVLDAARETAALHLWWLGQSGFLLQWEGRHLLMDPYLSDSLTEKYAGTDKPHVRMTERIVAPEKLDFIDVAQANSALQPGIIGCGGGQLQSALRPQSRLDRFGMRRTRKARIALTD